MPFSERKSRKASTGTQNQSGTGNPPWVSLAMLAALPPPETWNFSIGSFDEKMSFINYHPIQDEIATLQMCSTRESAASPSTILYLRGAIKSSERLSTRTISIGSKSFV